MREANITNHAPVETPGLTGYGSFNSIYLNWTAPVLYGNTTITDYLLYRGNSNGTEQLYRILNSNVTSFNDSIQMTNAFAYSYYLIANTSFGLSNQSTEISAIAITIPTIPLNLTALQINRSIITLNWIPPFLNGQTPISGYEIFRGTTNISITWLATIENFTCYNDSDINPFTTYYYTIAAINLVGMSYSSNITSIYVKTVPSMPQNFQGSPGNGFTTINWDTPQNDGGEPIIAYNIYRSTAFGVEELMDVVNGNVNAYNDTPVTNGFQYFYQISALNVIGEGNLYHRNSYNPNRTLIFFPNCCQHRH